MTYKADAESNIANIMSKLSTTSANEIDGRLSDALRNFLFGRDEAQDLAGRNIFRGRELGVPTYEGMAECYGTTPDPTVRIDRILRKLQPLVTAVFSRRRHAHSMQCRQPCT